MFRLVVFGISSIFLRRGLQRRYLRTVNISLQIFHRLILTSKKLLTHMMIRIVSLAFHFSAQSVW